MAQHNIFNSKQQRIEGIDIHIQNSHMNRAAATAMRPNTPERNIHNETRQLKQ